MSSFDLFEHHKEHARKAESRAAMLERELSKAFRILGLSLRVAAGQDADPIVLLRMLEKVDAFVLKPALTIEEAVQLLRDTDPDRLAVAT